MTARIPSKEYTAEYNAGWRASGRSGGHSTKFDSGLASDAWEDGYLDYAAGRAKWHLRDCPDHDNCGEG